MAIVDQIGIKGETTGKKDAEKKPDLQGKGTASSKFIVRGSQSWKQITREGQKDKGIGGIWGE
jgi:hypothetical protein